MSETEDEERSAHPPRGGHPLQPVQLDERGVARFKPNKIVEGLLEVASAHGMDLNRIACMNFPAEDHEQLAQLIGYSVSGAGELSYFSDAALDESLARVDALLFETGEQKPAAAQSGHPIRLDVFIAYMMGAVLEHFPIPDSKQAVIQDEMKRRAVEYWPAVTTALEELK